MRAALLRTDHAEIVLLAHTLGIMPHQRRTPAVAITVERTFTVKVNDRVLTRHRKLDSDPEEMRSLFQPAGILQRKFRLYNTMIVNAICQYWSEVILYRPVADRNDAYIPVHLV